MHGRETDPEQGGLVPFELTEPLRAQERAMLGTNSERVRCVALDAEIGQHSRCKIYDRRPLACKSVTASFEHGKPDAQCDRARTAHGLPLLTPSTWTTHAES